MKENMPPERQELVRSRSSTQEFLFSKTESQIKEDRTIETPFTGSDRLMQIFPDLSVGDAFIEAALSELSKLSYFSVMVFRIDALDLKNDRPDDNLADDILLAVARAVEETSKNENGRWGQLNPLEFGCFFPEKNSLFCFKIAEKFQKNIAARQNETVSIGIAVFPTTTYERDQIVENAYKALTHAAFFGPNSIVSFDSVSLNISADRLYQQGDVKRAIWEFKQALLLDPSNVNVYNSLGVCYGVLGQLDEALEEFKTAIALNTGEVMAIYNAGLIHTILGENDAGLQYFLDADSMGEGIFEVAFHIGKLYFDMDKPKKGIEFLKKALKISPESSLAFRYLGECYAAINRVDQAISVFTKAIKLSPNDPASLSALGHLYALQDKDLEIATMFCQQSVQISPDDGLFRHRLGRLYLKQNRLEESLKEFKKAQELGYDSDEYIRQIQNRQETKTK